MKFLFGLQHPLTCKPWTTLSNPCNKVRGKYICKEVFLLPFFMRLSVCVCLYYYWVVMIRQISILHQSRTPSFSQTIKQRWASRQFLSLPISHTLLPVTFVIPKAFRGCCYETIEEIKEAVTKLMDTLTQDDFQKLLERYNKCIAAGKY